MKKQKVISFLLAAALMLPFGTTAFAAAVDGEMTESKNTTTITIGSTLKLPTIKVTIGNRTDIIANPYQMTVDGSNASIITKPTSIQSNSTIDLKITATPTLSATSTTLQVLTETPTEDQKKTKYVALKYNMIAFANTVVGATEPSDVTNYTGAESGTQTCWIRKDSESGDPLTAVVTLPAAADETAAKSTWGAFKITGECGGSGWNAQDDKVTVKVAYAIEPVLKTGTAVGG